LLKGKCKGETTISPLLKKKRKSRGREEVYLHEKKKRRKRHGLIHDRKIKREGGKAFLR